MIIHPTHLTPPPRLPPRDHVYKGKFTNRSWHQLPPELVRAIATHYLLDLQHVSYCPLTWDAKELWHPRIVYTTFRDAIQLEKLMQVSPSWAAALETHLFWNKACAVLDPHDLLAHYQYVRPHPPPSPAGAAAAPAHLGLSYRISPFRHFRQMTARTCFVCRINSPFSSIGLAVAKRTHHTLTLGSIALCRDHRKNSFCGLCLREAPPAETDPQFDVHPNAARFTPYHQPYGQAMGVPAYSSYSAPLNPALMVCCADNEDDDTWPNVDATCRSCRSEWLWQRISTSLRDREAVGGPRFVPNSSRSFSTKDRIPHSRFPPSKYASADWETRQTVDAFIDLGEGSIAEVIAVAREKFWLRSQTKMPELMEQAVAATRWAGEGMTVDFAPVIHPPVEQHASSALHQLADADSPGRSTSPSPPSPRSVQRSRSPSPRSVYSSEYEGSEEEEDPELLSLTEDAGGVRELAIADWARTRILDGHWCNPADQWYGYAWPAGGGVRDVGEDTESEPDQDEDVRDGCTVRRTVRIEAVHPCPWTVTSNSSVSISATTSPTSAGPGSPTSPSSTNDSGDDTHPSLSTVRAHAPPSFGLCEQAYHAYQKQLRLILLPAMTNLVRKCVMEWTNGLFGLVDPATRVGKMGLEEVLAELRAPGLWFDGVDWAAGGLQTGSVRERERQRERERERERERDRDRERERDKDREEDSASSASSRSGGSHTTSPVLSTTTLQTTPSPPPVHEKEKDTCAAAVVATPPSPSQVPPPPAPTAPPVMIPIPISPVLPSPRLIHPIPYVPVTLAHMAQYSLDAFKNVWREACAPLYHCRCTICERATVKANMAAGHTVPSQGGQAQPAPPNAKVDANVKPQTTPAMVYQSHPTHPEVVLEEVRTAPRHAVTREEEEEEEEELYEEEEEEEGDEAEDEDEEEEEGDGLEAEEEEEDEESEDSSLDAHAHAGGGGSPRRRTPSTHLHTDADTDAQTGKIGPPRVNPRKRSSDDLDAVPGGDIDASVDAGATGGGTRVGTPPKRVKVGVHDSVAEERAVKGSVIISPPVTGTGKGIVNATTPTTPGSGSRQRKRSSEELDVSGGSASPRSGSGSGAAGGGEDKQQKRLRVDGSASVKVRERSATHRPHASAVRTSLRSSKSSPRSTSTSTSTCTSTPGTGLGASPPSSASVSASMRMKSVDVNNGDGGIGSLKAGLVNGGELDGLYVFEETS